MLALSFNDIKLANESASKVKTSLDLISIKDGVSVEWSSSDVSIIHDSTGAVSTVSTPTLVTMTATLTSPLGEKAEQQILMTVVPDTTNALTAVNLVSQELTIDVLLSGQQPQSVYKAINLPITGDYGAAIVWTTSDESVIATDGSVIRPDEVTGDQVITLTAEITVGGESVIRIFTMKVLHEPITDEERVAQDLANLSVNILGDSNKSLSSITADFGPLPTTGINGSNITWTSSRPDVVTFVEIAGSVYGQINRENEDVPVVISGEVRISDVVQTMDIVLNVKGLNFDGAATSQTTDTAELTIVSWTVGDNTVVTEFKDDNGNVSTNTVNIAGDTQSSTSISESGVETALENSEIRGILLQSPSGGITAQIQQVSDTSLSQQTLTIEGANVEVTVSDAGITMTQGDSLNGEPTTISTISNNGVITHIVEQITEPDNTAVIRLPNSSMTIDENGDMEAVSTVLNDDGSLTIINVALGVDGRSQHRVTNENGQTTTATTQLPGTEVTVGNEGIVTTTVTESSGVKAIVETLPNGTTTTYFLYPNGAEEKTTIESFVAGSSFEIQLDSNGDLEIISTIPLTSTYTIQ